MLPKSLKKLVLRKELSLVTEVIQSIDPQLCIQDAEGAYLLGNQALHPANSQSHSAAIHLEGKTRNYSRLVE